MNINIISINHKTPDFIKQGYHEYAKRLVKQDCTLTLTELSPLKPIKILEKIIELKAVAKNYIIALDEKGILHNTEQFANTIQTLKQSSKNIVFLIGGADGLLPECRNKANELWSLSPLTFPHLLVRVILAEQLYRAFSLLKNHPYHRS